MDVINGLSTSLSQRRHQTCPRLLIKLRPSPSFFPTCVARWGFAHLSPWFSFSVFSFSWTALRSETRCVKKNLNESVRPDAPLYVRGSGVGPNRAEHAHGPPAPLCFELAGLLPLQECALHNEGQGSKCCLACRLGSPRHTRSLTLSLYLNPASGHAFQRASPN